jgi:Na+-transporting methylmalonyl-CoA/oxaloacetate decarboxylase gamma subunit
MTGYIIAGVFIFILIIIIYFTAKVCKQLQAENNELKIEFDKQKATIAELLRHAEEIAMISSDKGKVENEIKNAKTDEELVAIANAIISTNNDRVRK